MKILTALLLNWVLLAFLIMPNIAQAFNKTMLSNGSEEFPAFIGGPINSSKGVIIIHDWFGITDLTNESTNRLIDKGVRVIAVDLYNGKSAETHDEAKALQKALNPNYAQKAILAAAKTLKKEGRRVIAIGYSAGAKFALKAATENPHDIHAVALIYGGGYGTIDQKMLTKIGPTLAIYGSEDEWSRKSFTVFNEQMDKVQKNIETYIYPNASHAFAQKLFNNGKNLDPVATKAMRNVLDGFLERNFSSKTNSKIGG